jgi:hypothetical protein
MSLAALTGINAESSASSSVADDAMDVLVGSAMMAAIRSFAGVVLFFVLVACSSTDPRTATGDDAAASVPARITGATVLLLPADVECAQVTAGGVAQPMAAWTETARANVRAALEAALAERGARLVEYDSGAVDPARAAQHERVLKLNEAVGTSIYFMQDYLPTKRAVFEWSVGEGAKTLAEDFDADYALFVFLRDSHASAGLIGMNVLKGVLSMATGLPVMVASGAHFGFAQLVDLETGNVFWFNKMYADGPGSDLRTSGEASQSIDRLLTGCPL